MNGTHLARRPTDMRIVSEYTPLVAKTCVVVCMLLTAAGCQWVGSRSSGADWDLTDAQRDSLDLYFQNYEDLLAYCKKRFKRWDDQFK